MTSDCATKHYSGATKKTGSDKEEKSITKIPEKVSRDMFLASVLLKRPLPVAIKTPVEIEIDR